MPTEFVLKGVIFFAASIFLILLLFDGRNRFHLRQRFSDKPTPVLLGFIASYGLWLLLSLWWLGLPLLESIMTAPRVVTYVVAASMTVVFGFGLALFLGQMVLVRFVSLFAVFAAILLLISGFFPEKTEFFENIAIELLVGGVATFFVFALLDSFYEREEKARFDALGNKMDELETQLDQVHKELVRQRTYPAQRDLSQPTRPVRIRPKHRTPHNSRYN